MIAVDASVVVAAGLPWHEAREAAFAVVRDGRARLPAHAAVEAYSVLTRLPPPNRATPADAVHYLARTFERPLLALSPAQHDGLLELLAGKGIAGGAVYDALVGAAVRHARGTLLTLDRRAIRSYEAVGVEYRLLP